MRRERWELRLERCIPGSLGGAKGKRCRGGFRLPQLVLTPDVAGAPAARVGASGRSAPSAPGDASFCSVFLFFFGHPCPPSPPPGPRLPRVANCLRCPLPLLLCFFSFRDSLKERAGSQRHGVGTGKRGGHFAKSHPNGVGREGRRFLQGQSYRRGRGRFTSSELDTDGGVCVCGFGKCGLKRGVLGTSMHVGCPELKSLRTDLEREVCESFGPFERCASLVGGGSLGS